MKSSDDAPTISASFQASFPAVETPPATATATATPAAPTDIAATNATQQTMDENDEIPIVHHPQRQSLELDGRDEMLGGVESLQDSPSSAPASVRSSGLWREQIEQRSRTAIHNFFYPNNKSSSTQNSSNSNNRNNNINIMVNEGVLFQQNNNNTDEVFVQQFWKTYDDIIILSLFTQVGIIFRLAAAGWFSYFDGTFRPDSALFPNLPLNCLSTFLLGLLSSGEDVLHSVVMKGRFKEDDTHFLIEPKEIDEDDHHHHHHHHHDVEETIDDRRQRRRKRQRAFVKSFTIDQHFNSVDARDDQYRHVQLQALERRMRASPSLVLFPARKQDVDVMEHYFPDGYRKNSDELREEQDQQRNGTPCTTTRVSLDDSNNIITSQENDGLEDVVWQQATPEKKPAADRNEIDPDEPSTPATSADSTVVDYATQNDRDLDQIIYHYSSNVASHMQNEFRTLSSNISRMRQVTLSEGWDVGTTPRAMSDGLMLGLRDGFCGALSSFSSWNSSMVGLIRRGDIGGAIVGYMLGLQLPIVSYKFGQHIAMYVFVWRWRRETRKDERRGYGIRISQEDEDETNNENGVEEQQEGDKAPNSELPSIRAMATALFVLSFVAQVMSLSFYNSPQHHQVALSLLFSPFGVLARWRLRRYNRLLRGFPVGTFTCNLLACALSGSVGQLIAGNPGPTERILLVSMISGFAGSLSSVGIFTIEVLKGTDPLMFRFDGFTYAICTIFWGMIIGLLSSSGVDWADRQPYQQENI